MKIYIKKKKHMHNLLQVMPWMHKIIDYVETFAHPSGQIYGDLLAAEFTYWLSLSMWR